MTTVAHNVEDERRRAWSDYADRLRGLEGAEYDQAEQEAWEALRSTLVEIGAGEPSPTDPAVG